jgi:hypothetical protein
MTKNTVVLDDDELDQTSGGGKVEIIKTNIHVPGGVLTIENIPAPVADCPAGCGYVPKVTFKPT